MEARGRGGGGGGGGGVRGWGRGEVARSAGEMLLYCSVFNDMIYKVDNIKSPS